MGTFPRLHNALAAGPTRLRSNAHESDYAIHPMDATWAEDTAKQHKHAFIQGWDTTYTGSALPSLLKAWTGGIGQGHPRMVGYVNGILQSVAPNAGSIPDAAYARSANDRTKYLKDGASGAGTYLMDPRSDDWVTNRITDAFTRYVGIDSWDGLYYDNIGRYGATGLIEANNDKTHTGPTGILPWNSRTNAAYTVDEWLADCQDLAHRVRAAVEAGTTGARPIFAANGVGNGDRFYNTDTAGDTSVLLNCADLVTFEIWLRSSTNAVNTWKTQAAWERDLNAVLETQQRGKVAQCLVKLWPAAGYVQADEDIWHRHAVASFLLAADGRSVLAFSADPDSATKNRTAIDGAHGEPYRAVWDELHALGQPNGEPTVVDDLAQGNAHVRHFDGGVVVINSTASQISGISLGGSYTAPSALWHPTGTTTAISTITLAAHDAAVLLA